MQAKYIRTMLEKSIQWVADHISQYVLKPGDLSRNRKLPVGVLLLYLLTAGCRSSVTELQKLFRQLGKTPTASALSMQLGKLKPEAVREMFHLFNEAQKSRGGRPPRWRFLCVDGTKFCCPDRDRNNPAYDAWRHTSGRRRLQGAATALYDMRAMRFLDAVIQPLHHMNEYRALCQLIDRLKKPAVTKTCIMADRGFPSWNVLGHAAVRGIYYLIRSKDAQTTGSILKNLGLPADRATYDEIVRVRLVRRSALLNEAIPEYRSILLYPHQEFDFAAYGSNEEFRLTLRVVRHKTDQGEYVTAITNLPSDEFSSRRIMQLYRERWTIETAFDHLKSALAMEAFHSHRPMLLEQEVWAKLTAFNYVSAMRRAANNAAHLRDKQNVKHMKHKYDVDFTYTCIASLSFLNPASSYYSESDLIDTVSRKRHAVGRKRDVPEHSGKKRTTPIPSTHRCAL